MVGHPETIHLDERADMWLTDPRQLAANEVISGLNVSRTTSACPARPALHFPISRARPMTSHVARRPPSPEATTAEADMPSQPNQSVPRSQKARNAWA